MVKKQTEEETLMGWEEMVSEAEKIIMRKSRSLLKKDATDWIV